MPTSLPTPHFDRFYRHPELTALLQAYADARPDLVQLRELGKSHEGRPIWVVVLTNTATGADEDKPAIWVDGNIHAAELTASTACLYWLHQLVQGYGSDAATTELLNTRVVYLVPRLNPDGAEWALADKPRHIRSSTRPYPFDEPHVDGLTVEDVDGDGRVLLMRIPDPHGGWKPHPEEPRVLIPRQPGEFGGTYYRVLPEGTVQQFDGVTLKANRDVEGLDLNRNFPSMWRQEFEQVGAGPYPTSEPEVRAMVDFIVKHPNIGAAVSFHTHSGVILRPMGTQSDTDMTPEDLWLIKRLSDIGTELTGYPSVSIFHDFKYHPKEVITGTQDWVYEHLGALFWTVEIWAPNKEAGITDYDWIHWYRDHPPEDDLKLLKWSDEQCGGLAHVDWYPFEHPQLGKVELGGWDRLNFWRNPPPHLREREAARFPKWLTQIGLTLPKLELLHATAEPLGDERWRVRLAVANAGYLPSHITKRAVERKTSRPCVFELDLPETATLEMGTRRLEGPHLDGHAAKQSLQAFLPSKELTADRAQAEWIVKAPVGTVLQLSAHAGRAGRVRASVTLG
ncbi:M14 family metallopeptidase [Ideonella paludis]|uniref:Carboxypeptidase n=1 Tax=Ideonella paludis TaxID=1233411 RepID=A0ABS5DZ36_9BURK|nr:M14 family metallopeptidase [Ideonella paludis]MBQ0936410.1 carboxypeptidase [Ideonella paludis]